MKVLTLIGVAVVAMATLAVVLAAPMA